MLSIGISSDVSFYRYDDRREVFVFTAEGSDVELPVAAVSSRELRDMADLLDQLNPPQEPRKPTVSPPEGEVSWAPAVYELLLSIDGRLSNIEQNTLKDPL